MRRESGRGLRWRYGYGTSMMSMDTVMEKGRYLLYAKKRNETIPRIDSAHMFHFDARNTSGGK